MPISIQIPEGLVTRDEEEKLVEGLSDTILDINGAKNNSFVRRNLIVDVTTRSPDRLYADSKRVNWVNVTLRIPPSSLDGIDKQREFVTRMTDVVVSVIGSKLPKDRIYINLIRGDEFWGIGGVTFSNDELLVHAMKFGNGQPSD